MDILGLSLASIGVQCQEGHIILSCFLLAVALDMFQPHVQYHL